MRARTMPIYTFSRHFTLADSATVPAAVEPAQGSESESHASPLSDKTLIMLSPTSSPAKDAARPQPAGEDWRPASIITLFLSSLAYLIRAADQFQLTPLVPLCFFFPFFLHVSVCI